MQQNSGQLLQGSQQQPMQVARQPQQQQQYAQPVIQPPPKAPVPCCGRPPAGEPEGWYKWCIASIVMHSLSLFFLGFYVWSVWLAFLFSVICGSVILCGSRRDRQSYQANCICQAVAAVFDAISITVWIAWLCTYNAYEGYYAFLIWTLALSVGCLVCAMLCSVASHTAVKYQRTLAVQQIVVAMPNVGEYIQSQQMSYHVGPDGQMIPAQSASIAVHPMYPGQQVHGQQPGPQMAYVGATASQQPVAYASQMEYNRKM